MPAAEPAASAPRKGVSSTQVTHPMNSSRLFLDLMSLAKSDSTSDPWNSVIRRSAMRSLMLALQYRDASIVQHSRRVATMSVGVGEYLGWEGRHLQILEAASLLHDVGKIGIPDIVLNKPGSLAPDEAELMGLLYRIAGDVLQASGADSNVIQIVTQTQYHFNGAGQDFDLIGSDVHQGARILSVIDSYDSLVTPQTFRGAHTHEDALEILSRGAGSKYDGNVLAAMNRWFENNGVPDNDDVDGTAAYQLSPEEMLEAGTLCHVFSYLYLLESLYHGFYVTSPDGKLQLWSRGCEELIGTDWQTALQAPSSNSLIQYRNRFGAELEDHERPVRVAAQTGRIQTTELQIHTADNHWVPVEVQTLPMIDPAGRLCGFAEIFRDLSGRRQKGSYRDLKLMASRDALTHVANRGELIKYLDRQMSEYEERGSRTPFSLIFLDVDHFKRTNDTFGHAAGDEVLISLARLLQNETYSGELVSRYGGEEFVILCPETPLEDGFQKAERLRLALESSQVVNSDEFKITASFGVSQVEAGDTAESVLQRADKALYMSKHQGRNCTNKLTGQQLRNNDPQLVNPPDSVPPANVLETTVRACVAADMIVFKIRAFVDGVQGRLRTVKEDNVTIDVGQKGLVPMWGNTPDKQPVRIDLYLGNGDNTVIRGVSSMLEIGVKIQPLGWARDLDVFEKRARGVLKELKEYLAAESD